MAEFPLQIETVLDGQPDRADRGRAVGPDAVLAVAGQVVGQLKGPLQRRAGRDDLLGQARDLRLRRADLDPVSIR